MPQSAAQRRAYGPEWPAIRAAILARAGNACEGSSAYPDCRARNREPHPITGSPVVLTIAHLDHDAQAGRHDPERLAALCQRCHLTHDAKHHARNAATTRRRKMLTAELAV
jgi:5-methylcytosine-specific restriction endonuclease McrA